VAQDPEDPEGGENTADRGDDLGDAELGVQMRAAKFAMKMLMPKVTTSWASPGPFITLLMMNR
jgi:hypothetical protein